MQVKKNGRLEYVSYRLKNVAHIWFTHWKENSVQMQFITHKCFSEYFVDKFFP